MGKLSVVTKPLEDLFRRLSVLKGLLLHLENYLEIFESSIRRSLDENKFDIAYLFAGFALGIRDLTLREDYGVYPAGRFVTQGEEYIRLVDTLLVRQSAWAISQAFEAFETFLRDLYAHHLFAYQNTAERQKIKKCNSTLAKQSLEPNQIEYWLQFVRLAKYNSFEILDRIREQSPELETIEKNNSYNLNLVQWLLVVAEVRHAVTHSNMLVKDERVKNWSQSDLDILKSWFRADHVTGGYEVKPTVTQAEMNLEIFGGYGYIIYKLLNDLQGAISEILNGRLPAQ